MANTHTQKRQKAAHPAAHILLLRVYFNSVVPDSTNTRSPAYP